jgi:phage shock protein PspC (stress-responsive transcriptional regulator)
MQKVISINLNGHAYQLDESGYEQLRDYLARAERTLKDNPDRTEIMSDLEQAIADKCQRFLGPDKSVVTTAEVDQIVREMGPVDGAPDAKGDAATEPAPEPAAGSTSPTRTRLYRIQDGAMIAGVCTGLAAYLKIDVAIVRAVFVAAALVTKGVAIMAYVLMMFVVPEANTPEERAAAGDQPFNAQDIIDRVKKQYAAGHRHWRRQWRRRQRREARHRAWGPGVPQMYGPPPPAAMLLPVFSFAHIALFMIAAAMMVSLVNTGAILSWRLPEDIPVWAGALMLLAGYQIVTAPIRVAEYWSWPAGRFEPGWHKFWNAVIWLLGLALMVWVASDHLPELREFIGRVPQLFREAFEAFRELLRR